MIRKLSFLVGLGTGYVLGAKAGEQRYTQIMGKARELAGMPAVQEATSTLSSATSTVAGNVADKAKAGVDSLVDLTSSTPASNGTATNGTVGAPGATPQAGSAAKTGTTGSTGTATR